MASQVDMMPPETALYDGAAAQNQSNNDVANQDATAEPTEEDRQSYPLGQSHTPLTSIPTLGQALLDGNTIDRKYVHSFLQVLADHSQFSDKYQLYEEDEYERKRKRKLRESERKMFFYAGQKVTSIPGDKGGKSGRSKSASSGSAAASKKRRRKEGRDLPDASSSSPSSSSSSSSIRNLSSSMSAPMLHQSSDMSTSSSPYNSPPTSIPMERASMPNMPSIKPPMMWDHPHPHQQQHHHQLHHHQLQQQQETYPQGYPQQQQQSLHSAGSHMLRQRASMPQMPIQRSFSAHSSLSSYGNPHPHHPHHQLHHHHHHPLHHSMPSSSFDYVPQTSPYYSTSSPQAVHSPHPIAPSPSSSSSSSHIVAGGDFDPHPHQLHHHPLHHPQQSSSSSYGYMPHHHHQADLPYHAHQQPSGYHHHHHHQQTQQTYQQYAAPIDVFYKDHAGQEPTTSYGGGSGDAWMAPVASSATTSMSSGASGELGGCESFSTFGPFDPASLGVSTTDGTQGSVDATSMTCSDMAAAAAAAAESFALAQQQQGRPYEESSPEADQRCVGSSDSLLFNDEDWLNSFFSDPSACGSPFLGGASSSAMESDPCAVGDTSHIDAFFSDVESLYGRMVN